MFSTLLIANRGEIARRIQRTARRLGVRTVAVYSDADAQAPFVREADAAVRIGPPPARESYLRTDAILDAARATGAEAIHPGYGFLSENAAFAEACADAGIVFIGPKPHAIRAMGRKDEAKALMSAAGVPVTPGYQGDDQTLATLSNAASEIGYPVLIKAVAGGGGKGMRRVDAPGDFAAMLDSAKREAASAFGDDRVLIEKYILGPRHIEVQVFGDLHGGAIHLFERDCSVQRRHQKVIEEAPAPGMTDAVRAAMTAAAVAAARAVDYVGAGTVEFIVDGSGPLRPDGFWFMEMNTRLQVEHPVTEEITGLDLVELQLRVAAGERLPAQDAVVMCGHAVEVRLYAEDPATGFLPSIGRLDTFDVPLGEHLRLDAGVEAGGEVTPFYDPMIAKVIARGDSRTEAIDRLAGALEATRLAPLRANTGFLARCLRHPAFIAGGVDTGFLAAHEAEVVPGPPVREVALLAAAVEMVMRETEPRPAAGLWADPWSARDGFRLNAPPRINHAVSVDGVRVDLALGRTSADPGADWRARFPDGQTAELRLAAGAVGNPRALPAITTGALEVELDGRPVTVGFDRAGEGLMLYLRGDAIPVGPPHAEAAAEALEAADEITAPMPGKVIAVRAAAGDTVQRGQVLLVLEAMKMEHALTAPRDGQLAELRATPGAQVAKGAVLARLTPLDG